MIKIPQIAAGMGSEIGCFDLGDCFFRAGEAICAAAYDGITKNANGAIGCPTDEFFQGHFIVAFYNYRHAIELKMKKLASILNVTGKFGHRLSDLWDEILKHPKVRSDETVVTEALLVLAEYDVLQDEELFRYEQRNKQPTQALRNYPAIPAKYFQLMGAAYHELRFAILQLAHESNMSVFAAAEK